MTEPVAGADSGEITVRLATPGWAAVVPAADSLARTAVATTLALACPGLGAAGVAIVLTDDAMVRDLNRRWRSRDTPTNVLSFPAEAFEPGTLPVPALDGLPLELGDVVLACETCLAEAASQGKPPADHLQHLVVHGVLHLLGHDHVADAEAARMERLERDILTELGVPDPYRT